MKEKIKAFINRLKTASLQNEVLWKNEIQSNKTLGRLMYNSILVLIVVMVLVAAGFFPLDQDFIGRAVVPGIFVLAVPLMFSYKEEFAVWWIKYMNLAALIVAYAFVDMMMTFTVSPLMMFPVVVSSRYFSQNLTIITAIITAVVFGVSTWLGALYGLLNMNSVMLPAGTTITSTGTFIGVGIRGMNILDMNLLIKNTMLYYYLPRLFIFILVASVCARISSRGREMINETASITKKTSRMESELSLAKDLQASMLPSVFPPFPDHKEFDIYAIMQPAKEIAGDFYDFCMPDENTLAVVMADVSGKGVPAALFMTISKALIKNYVKQGIRPDEVLNIVNHMLSEDNESGFFVTGWIGFLDIRTGHMVYANAGHTPPAICHNGHYELLKCKPGFILGGMDNFHFTSAELDLKPGDSIYLYTDGVSEADNENEELYGEQRLLDVLNANVDCDMKELCFKVKESVETYSAKVEQFDDLTMLALRYIGKEVQESVITVKAELDNLAEVTDFMNDVLDSHGCPEAIRVKLDIALDELYSNVAKHAYKELPEKGDFTLSVKVDDATKIATIKLIDSGKEFDPVAYVNPELIKPALERKIGGLGLFMVKKIVDTMEYQRQDDKNIVTLTKALLPDNKKAE